MGDQRSMFMKSIAILLLGFAVMTAAYSEPLRPGAQQLIEHFKMEHIPDEGPWFTLTWRSNDVFAAEVLPARYDGARVAGNAIIGLITTADFSALHRLKTDEIWHYYLGDPLQMLLLHPDGSGEVLVLGPDVLHGQKLQVVVPRGVWQGALPMGDSASTYTLFGDTLAPGFEYGDFESGYRNELQQQYPKFAAMIAKLTRQEFVQRPAASSSSAAHKQ